MLHLVFTDRHNVSAIEQNVCGLQHRIIQQTRHYLLLPACFVFELRLTLEFTERRDGIEDPSELGMFRHLRLHIEGGDGRIDAGGKKSERHLVGAAAEIGGLIRCGDRVIIHDAEERVELVLERDPILYRTEIVSDMEFA